MLFFDQQNGMYVCKNIFRIFGICADLQCIEMSICLLQAVLYRFFLDVNFVSMLGVIVYSYNFNTIYFENLSRWSERAGLPAATCDGKLVDDTKADRELVHQQDEAEG
eukprot:TRINITY_DN16694_c0_g2_i3.p2 TRINITY_DN16694_c0_g2~~TRINITY_DN16694_c0_g2_i3.p2  ORF type:complete len:108 (-),score=3.22 TRINITY_DN16694_c0_g2_i3:234-557(-)